jgi:hypothetical protein
MMRFKDYSERFRLAASCAREKPGLVFTFHLSHYMLFSGGTKKIRCRERFLVDQSSLGPRRRSARVRGK